MKFSCEKAILSQAVGLASRTVSPKSALEVLEGICVRAGMSLQMTGYNLETGITVGVEAEVLEQGAASCRPVCFPTSFASCPMIW